MSRFGLFAAGNALTDILVKVDDGLLAKFGLSKGSANFFTADQQGALLEQLGDRNLELCSGGSVANSIIAFAALGGKASFSCRLGDDRYGHFYRGEFSKLGINLNSDLVVNEGSGTCICLITPDSERTMCFSLGAGAGISMQQIEPQNIIDSEWVFIEGYQFANGAKACEMISSIVKIAKENKVKVAITFSESFIISSFGDQVRQCVESADLVFANSEEACSFTGASDVQQAFEQLCQSIPSVVVTCGPEGALIQHNGNKHRVCAFPCKPIDLTGAGDMFAGSFLYGITNNLDIDRVGRAACYLAMKVITKVGARLHGDIKQLWEIGYAAS